MYSSASGFIIALSYGSQCEWVKDVLAAGGCEPQDSRQEISAFHAERRA
jgi:hypothetical protein